MRTIDEYIDAAKSASSIQSDVKLAAAIGIHHSAVSQWRTKRTWPADATMVKLSELAGVDPHEGLVDLSIWRNGDNGHVQALWADLKKKLTPIAASVCLIMGLSAALPPDAQGQSAYADMPGASLIVMVNMLARHVRRLTKSGILPRYQRVIV